MGNLLLLINLKIIIPLIPFRAFFSVFLCFVLFFLLLFFSGTNACAKKIFCLIQTEIKSMAYILAAPTAIIISPRLYSCLVSHKGNKLFKS